MVYKLLYIILASASICYSKQNGPVEEVEISLYYEVLCPGCIEFYTKEITNIVKKLGNSVDIYTFPFGNARFVDDNQTAVECQHGPQECYGNKLHACAQRLLMRAPLFVEFNACLLPKHSNDEAADACGKSQEIDPKAIKMCAQGKEGQRLLIEAGKDTYKVRPAQKYTPYVLIDGKEYDLDTDFMEAVCKAFVKPPSACKMFNIF